ncbi:MAG: hypothetical protein ACRC1D_06915 [Culicoidibacterales bacterium]
MDDDSQQITSITDFTGQRCVAKKLNVSGCISELGTITVLKAVIRKDLFRYMKFPDSLYDYDFTTRPETICGTILRHTDMLENATREYWWKESKQLVVKTYTHHQNNCIKNIKLKYKGTETMYMLILIVAYPLHTNLLTTYRIAEILKATNNLQHLVDMDYVLNLRRNLTHYVQFIDAFAPCLLRISIWDGLLHSLTVSNCGDFMNRRFTTGDEAFILLVLINYHDLWRAEVEQDARETISQIQKKQKHVRNKQV